MRKYVRLFALAVLAGAAIGIGGIVFLSLENKIVGALMFTAGLYSICVHGLNLFTGKVGYAVEQPKAYIIDLVIIWVGNLAGTWLAAMGVLGSRINGISEKAQSMCQIKVDDSLISLFILGIFCGALMYIAVEGYKQTKNPLILSFVWQDSFFADSSIALRICSMCQWRRCGPQEHFCAWL